MCYDEWKQQHPETPDDVFEGHWKALSRKDKGVSEVLPPYLIYSHTSLSRSEVHVIGKEGCTLFVQSLLLPFTEIVLLQGPSSGQDASA